MFDEGILHPCFRVKIDVQPRAGSLLYSSSPPGIQVEKLENKLLAIKNQKDEAIQQDLLMFIKSMPENQLKVMTMIFSRPLRKLAFCSLAANEATHGPAVAVRSFLTVYHFLCTEPLTLTPRS